MNYSDEKLYQQLIALSHQLRRLHGNFPPRRPDAASGRMEADPREGFPPRGPMPPEHPFPDMHRSHAYGRPGPFGGHYPPFSGGRRPPLARERILRLVGEMEPVSQTALAEQLAIRPQSLSEQLARLEDDGFILRVPSEQDKRVILVSLSEQGRQRAQEVEAARAEQSSAFFSVLSQEEREQLFLLLQKLLERK